MPTQLDVKPAPTMAPEEAILREIAHRISNIDKVVRSISMSINQWRREVNKILVERPDLLDRFRDNEHFQQFLKEKENGTV